MIYSFKNLGLPQSRCRSFTLVDEVMLKIVLCPYFIILFFSFNVHLRFTILSSHIVSEISSTPAISSRNVRKFRTAWGYCLIHVLISAPHPCLGLKDWFLLMMTEKNQSLFHSHEHALNLTISSLGESFFQILEGCEEKSPINYVRKNKILKTLREKTGHK